MLLLLVAEPAICERRACWWNRGDLTAACTAHILSTLWVC